MELLGVGSVGEVWKAFSPSRKGVEPVALKFCFGEEMTEWLRHEARVFERISGSGPNEGVVRLNRTFFDSDPACLEYELVEGGDLASLAQLWHSHTRKPTPYEVAKVIYRICKTLEPLHAKDVPIVHRDLKPSNILIQAVSNERRIKITDFGIGGFAGLRGGSNRPWDDRSTLTYRVRGAFTPLYASPEQQRGSAPDPRDDVHAIGVIWYQFLTGRLEYGPPAGGRWRGKLQEMGLTGPQIELLSDCFETEAGHRPKDAGTVADRTEELYRIGGKRGPAIPVGPAGRSGTEGTTDPPPTLTHKTGMEFVLIPAGEYQMGSSDREKSALKDERPRHLVVIREPFYLSRHPVTVGQFRQFVETMGYRTEAERDGRGGYCRNEANRQWERQPGQVWSHPRFSTSEDLPVVLISWGDSMSFVEWLIREEGFGYRLPSEEEWEYACRAGTKTKWSCGNAPTKLAEHAWFLANSEGRAHPVGAKRPNPWGLYDMHGNVCEWTQTLYTENYELDPGRQGAPGHKGEGRYVLRGGGFGHSAENIRSAKRFSYVATDSFEYVGFRVARAVNLRVQEQQPGRSMSGKLLDRLK